MPGTLGEALAMMAAEPGRWRPLAGGTDLMVALGGGSLPAADLLDLSGLAELRGLRETPEAFVFGSLTTFTEVREWAPVHRWLPNLARSAGATGALAIQNRGTLGGNLANASPAADTPPSLLAYGAEVGLVSLGGVRRVPYDRFHLGYKRLDMAPGELLLEIRVPRPEGRTFHYFRKVGTRRALAVTKISLAAFARIEEGRVAECRVALGSVGPTPLRAPGAEAVLRGALLAALPVAEAQRALMDDISPMDDLRSTAHYRRATAYKLLGQMLRELAGASAE
jgi:CO/xanthine dehydrogenase FAD-binding subunit